MFRRDQQQASPRKGVHDSDGPMFERRFQEFHGDRFGQLRQTFARRAEEGNRIRVVQDLQWIDHGPGTGQHSPFPLLVEHRADRDAGFGWGFTRAAAAIGKSDLRRDAADPKVRRGGGNRVRGAVACAPKPDASRIDLAERLQEGDAVVDILDLPPRDQPAARSLAFTEAPVIEGQGGNAGPGEPAAVVRQDELLDTREAMAERNPRNRGCRARTSWQVEGG